MTMTIRTDREYRAFQEFRLVEEDGMWIKGYAAVFNSPTVLYKVDGKEYKEQLERSAFDQADMKDVILNYNHAGKVVARTRNKTLSLEVNDVGLYIRAKLDGTEEGRRLFEEVKGGYMDKMSFAFTVKEDSYDKETRTRSILAVDRLYDVSVVSIPAYAETSVSARAHFEQVAQSEIEALARAEALEMEKAKYEYLKIRRLST
jgi:uncharacterized protein